MTETIQKESIVTHRIDLTKPVSQRLRAVLKAETESAHTLYLAARRELRNYPEWIIERFGELYRDYDGPFCAELDAWAREVGGTFGELATVNCSYELDHLEHRWSIPEIFGKALIEWIARPFGCTAGVREVQGLGMVHMRNLDWPIPTMGSATRLFRYQTKQHEFISIGFPAFVGVLSGMVPGEYSATINWAPPSDMPDFHWSPSALLRKTLEECRTYQQAVERLSHAPLSTGVFYTVCGKAPGEACVIERTADQHVIRQLDGGVEAQSNHYVSDEFAERNEILETEYARDPLIKTSEARRPQMLEQLESISEPTMDLADLLDLLAAEPVNNEETVQRMVFCPAKGELHLDRRIDQANGQPVWSRSEWKAD
jgi:Acyl-coenzyme A:6-aminopenicillanic acid acyl-transferase